MAPEDDPEPSFVDVFDDDDDEEETVGVREAGILEEMDHCQVDTDAMDKVVRENEVAPNKVTTIDPETLQVGLAVLKKMRAAVQRLTNLSKDAGTKVRLAERGEA